MSCVTYRPVATSGDAPLCLLRWSRLISRWPSWNVQLLFLLLLVLLLSISRSNLRRGDYPIRLHSYVKSPPHRPSVFVVIFSYIITWPTSPKSKGTFLLQAEPIVTNRVMLSRTPPRTNHNGYRSSAPRFLRSSLASESRRSCSVLSHTQRRTAMAAWAAPLHPKVRVVPPSPFFSLGRGRAAFRERMRSPMSARCERQPVSKGSRHARLQQQSERQLRAPTSAERNGAACSGPVGVPPSLPLSARSHVSPLVTCESAAEGKGRGPMYVT